MPARGISIQRLPTKVRCRCPRGRTTSNNKSRAHRRHSDRMWYTAVKHRPSSAVGRSVPRPLSLDPPFSADLSDEGRGLAQPWRTRRRAPARPGACATIGPRSVEWDVEPIARLTPVRRRKHLRGRTRATKSADRIAEAPTESIHELLWAETPSRHRPPRSRREPRPPRP